MTAEHSAQEAVKATHDCVERLNGLLAEHNTQFANVIVFGSRSLSDYIQIATAKVDTAKRGKPQLMFAVYCPFCGVSLRIDEQSATTESPTT